MADQWRKSKIEAAGVAESGGQGRKAGNIWRHIRRMATNNGRSAGHGMRDRKYYQYVGKTDDYRCWQTCV